MSFNAGRVEWSEFEDVVNKLGLGAKLGDNDFDVLLSRGALSNAELSDPRYLPPFTVD